MRKHKNTLTILALLVALAGLLVLAGCPAPQRQPAPPPPNAVPGPAPGTRDARDINPNAPGRQMTPAPAPAPEVTRDGTAEARRLATMIDQMPEVNTAYVILSGRMAIVGLDMKENISNARVNAVKAEVIRKVKRANERVDNVTVTADPNIVTRIQRVADGLAQGRPLSSFANEMAEITRRLVPANE